MHARNSGYLQAADGRKLAKLEQERKIAPPPDDSSGGGSILTKFLRARSIPPAFPGLGIGLNVVVVG